MADRVEIHVNVRELRENWNNRMLNSINMITRAVATMARIPASIGVPLLAFKVSPTLLFSATVLRRDQDVGGDEQDPTV